MEICVHLREITTQLSILICPLGGGGTIVGVGLGGLENWWPVEARWKCNSHSSTEVSFRFVAHLTTILKGGYLMTAD